MRFISLFYFLLKADYQKIWQSIRCQRKHHCPLRMALDALYCSLYYGTSLNDYFNFRFFEKTHKERNTFAGMYFMYRFHKTLNDQKLIGEIDNKIRFAKNFVGLAGPSRVFSAKNSKHLFVKWVKKEGQNEIVVKDPAGSGGSGLIFADYMPREGVFQVEKKTFDSEVFMQRFSHQGLLYAEPRLKPHPALAEFAPWSLNSIRVVTVVTHDHKVDLIAAVFRVSLGSGADNFSAGNIAAPINIETGEVSVPARQKLSACSPLFYHHPKTGIAITGFTVPAWDRVIETVKKAAMVIPEVRTVGWDVAVLKDRVVVLEGNPKWNKDTVQIPPDKGIKEQLQQYL